MCGTPQDFPLDFVCGQNSHMNYNMIGDQLSKVDKRDRLGIVYSCIEQQVPYIQYHVKASVRATKHLISANIKLANTSLYFLRITDNATSAWSGYMRPWAAGVIHVHETGAQVECDYGIQGLPRAQNQYLRTL